MKRLHAVAAAIAVIVASVVVAPARGASGETPIEVVTFSANSRDDHMAVTNFDPAVSYVFKVSGTAARVVDPSYGTEEEFDAFYLFACKDGYVWASCPVLPYHDYSYLYVRPEQGYGRFEEILNGGVLPPYNDGTTGTPANSYTLTATGLSGPLKFGNQYFLLNGGAQLTGEWRIEIYESACPRTAASAQDGCPVPKEYDWVVKFKISQKGLQDSPDPVGIIKTITKGSGAIRFDEKPTLAASGGIVEKLVIKQTDHFAFVRHDRLFGPAPLGGTTASYDAAGRYIGLFDVKLLSASDASDGDPCPDASGSVILYEFSPTVPFENYLSFQFYPDPPEGCQVDRSFRPHDENKMKITVSEPKQVKQKEVV